MIHQCNKRLLEKGEGEIYMSGLFRAELDECAAAAPVPGHRLGIQGRLEVVFLRAAREDVAGQPELVADVDPTAGAHLVRPLPRHHLTAGTCRGMSGGEQVLCL